MIAIAGPTVASTPSAHVRAIRRVDVATLLIAVTVALVAFGLRVYRLDAQSLWSDEGASVVMTYRGMGEIAVAAAGDIHPPLYYWLLAAWANLGGRTEFALRFLSALQGVALVAVTYRLGRLLLDRPAALLGALFAAVSPLLIYYSQEARMYEQLALFGTAGALCAVLWWRAAAARARWWPWAVGVVVCFIAAMWSQFFAAGALLGASLAFVARFPNPFRHWRHWVAWAVSQLLVIAGVAPWLLYASNQLRSWAVDTEPLSATEFALRTLRYLAFGMAWDETVTGKTVALAVGLLLAAAVWPVVGGDRAVRTRGLAMTVLLALAPILLLFVVSQNRPVYHPKFLIGALPAFALLQGAGVAAVAGGASWLVARLAPSALRRPAAIVVVAVMVVGLLGAHAFAVGRALVAAYGDAKYARDDYRGIARYLETVSRPGDVILLNAPGQREIWDYYYRGNLPVVGLPGQRPAEDARTVADLVALTAQAKRVWVVFWAAEQADPRGVVERWLNEQTFRAANRWYGGVRLVLYSVPVQTEAGAIQSPREVVFEQGARLLGYSLATPSATPGDTLQLTLFWQGAQPLNERYTVFTHLIDPAELIWAQRDAEPGSGSRPTTEWRPGEMFADRYGLPVVTGAPPGEYVLEVGLYRASDGVRLGVVDEAGRVVADRVLLGPVSVDRPDRQPEVSALFIEHPRETPHGPLTFLGYDLQKLGFDRGVTDFRTGDLAHLTLFWRAPSRPGADRPLVLELRDSTGRVAIRETRAVTNGLYPLSRWQAGDVVRDQHKLLLGVPAGQYRVFAGLEGERLMDLGLVTVR